MYTLIDYKPNYYRTVSRTEIEEEVGVKGTLDCLCPCVKLEASNKRRSKSIEFSSDDFGNN